MFPAGHGGQQPDEDGDEEEGMDETLIPVDFDKNGHIIDDDILKVSGVGACRVPLSVISLCDEWLIVILFSL